MNKRTLIVDDEKLFLTSLKEGLETISHITNIDISFTVNEAIKRSISTKYDLIITDIRMPEKNGIDLLLFLKNSGFSGRLMVMTAYNDTKTFGTIQSMGIMDIIYKPFELNWFKEMLINFYRNNKPVTFESIDLMTVLQIINLEKKTAEIDIATNTGTGKIFFVKGEMYQANFEKYEGEKAVMQLIARKSPDISIKPGNETIIRVMKMDFVEQMMHIMKKIDELRKEDIQTPEIPQSNKLKKENKMAIKEILNSLKEVSGYLGAGVFTPQGELLEGEADASGIHFETSGSMLHDTLQDAKQMSQSAGFGNADMIQVDTESGLLFCKCYNSNGVHFHIILLIKKDGNVALAKMRLNKAISAMIPEFQ